jgi:hypothetical protein
MHAPGNRIWGFTPELFDEARIADRPPPTREEQQAMARVGPAPGGRLYLAEPGEARRTGDHPARDVCLGEPYLTA